MQRFKKVKCANCTKSFYKSKWHVKENLNLGHNFYCSSNCFSNYRKTGKVLKCENNLCGKEFYRVKNAILKHNYCSRSCAAKVNNYKFPKWPTRYCRICQRVVKREGSPYCSIKCGKAGRFKYTKEQILGLVKKYHSEIGRVPAKRELLEISNRAAKLFGSWNQTLITAGLIPNRSHDHRMYKRTNTKAFDGHLCDSISEAIIDNWLTKNKIAHVRNAPYPSSSHLADWSIGKKTFVEYFGLFKDSPRYDREVRKKRNFCKKLNIKLVEIYPADLYPKISLENKLSLLGDIWR